MNSISVSDHATLRWLMRARRFHTPLRYAWEDAVEIDEHGTLFADEIRYHPQTETLLVSRNHNVTTVLNVSTVDPDVRAAVAQVEGGR